MASREPVLLVADLTGGINDTDPPIALSEKQVTAATNVDYFQSTLGRKRHGCSALGMTGYTGAGTVASLIRHTPTADETGAELWAFPTTFSTYCHRLAASTTWADVTWKDALGGTSPYHVYGVSFNGKLFLAYDTSVDRLHCWDGSTMRRCGFDTPAAPAVADTGSGAYAATIRYYQVAYATLDGTDVLRRSERSAVTTFTPSGSGTAARLTKPAALSEGETHWEIYGSADGANYYRLDRIVVGTTTYDDSAAPSTYATVGTLADVTGENTAPPSAKYLLVDESRLLLLGSWETTALQSRVQWTPILGTSDVGDDERIRTTTSVKSYVDLDRQDGGGITGGGGPIAGCQYVFKTSHTYKLVRTGVDVSPYVVIPVSKEVGCLAHQSIVLAEDDNGSPALYWLSRKGPYRIGTNGMQYLGRYIESTWATVNLSASTVLCHGVYHAAKRQVWWWLATGSSATPDTVLVFDVRRGAFTTFTGTIATAKSSVMFSAQVGSTMSLDLLPYGGHADALILKGDVSSAYDDNGTAFQASVTTKPMALGGPLDKCGVTSVELFGPASHAQVHVQISREFGAETRTGIVSLVPEKCETHVWAPTDVEMTEARTVQLTIGDENANTYAWQVDALALRYRNEGPR